MNTALPHRKLNFVQLLFVSLLAVCLTAAMWLFRSGELVAGLPLLVIPFVILFISAIFVNPMFGFLSMFVANYFALGISRYLPGPLGLSVDGLLVLTWFGVFLSQFNKKVEWKKAATGLTLASVVWYLYALFQLVNPETRNRKAWFYAMRGVSLYMMLTAPLTLVLFNQKKHLDLMLKLWGWFTIFAMLKGAQQLIIGVDPWEHYWLATVGGKTHLLAQGLRVFSFFSDAATYGSSMGYSCVVFFVISLDAETPQKKRFYRIVAASAFYAMLISGTRGAIAIPFGGFALYALLTKKVKILILSGLIGGTTFGVLKYTTLGNNVNQIRRFRGALDPENPSLVVRHENQKLLKAYLASRPFGGGIGSAGNWGLRFSPGTFLAQTPTDSWYVQIWAEQGRVGLTLHLIILFYILGNSIFIIWFRLKNPYIISKAIALTAGLFGLMGASYGSGALGQMPNGVIVYTSMAFVVLMPS